MACENGDGSAQAGPSSAPPSTTETDGDRLVESNVRTTLDLLEVCRAEGRPFIYASSAATYGDGAEGFVDDASIPALARLKPLNPYGWSKHLFDRRVARMAAEGQVLPPQWAAAFGSG